MGMVPEPLHSYHRGMNGYILKCYGPRLNETGTRKGLGHLAFSAEGDPRAVAFARAEFEERISSSDYAAIWNDAGKIIWESKGWDA